MQHLIIGAGPAGVVAAESIRKYDSSSTVTLISNEPDRPYSRLAIPHFLQGKIDENATYFRRGSDYFAAHSIDVRKGSVVKVDALADAVNLEDGSRLEYDRLLIATGTRPEKPTIPGNDLPCVVNCWTLEDARKIASYSGVNSEIIIVDAGFIGCIILDALARTGVRLNLIEKGNHILPHLMNEASSRLIRSWCEAKGVTVRTSTDIKVIEKKTFTEKSDKSHSQQLSVLLNSGESLPADMVIFATGTTMNTAFLEGSDIAYKQGVLVDECLNTTTPKVYAAGDVCQGIDFTAGKRRVQAIQLTASEHGRIAAANMCGLKAKYPGSITMNVLNTLGFVSSSFGLWGGVDGGESITDSDSSSYTYLNLQFKEDLLIGATSLGNAEHISLLPRLIHSRVPLKL